GDAGGYEGGIHIAPGNRHRATPAAIGAHELARLPAQRDFDDLTGDSRTTAFGESLDAGPRRARTGAADGFEGEHEMAGIRHALFQHGGHAVGRYHVEAGARKHHHALVPGARMRLVAMR